jgi:hypothetical protein
MEHQISCVFWLVMSIWSGMIVFAKIIWKSNIHPLNLIWFAVSVAFFLWELGIFNK